MDVSKEVSSKSVKESGEVELKTIEPGKSHGIYHGLLYIDPKNVFGVVSVKKLVQQELLNYQN